MDATLLVCLLMGLIAVSYYSYTYVSRWRPHWFEPRFIYEYKRAAELGDARAQYDLGHYYASVNDRDRWWSSDSPRDYRRFPVPAGSDVYQRRRGKSGLRPSLYVVEPGSFKFYR